MPGLWQNFANILPKKGDITKRGGWQREGGGPCHAHAPSWFPANPPTPLGPFRSAPTCYRPFPTMTATPIPQPTMPPIGTPSAPFGIGWQPSAPIGICRSFHVTTTSRPRQLPEAKFLSTNITLVHPSAVLDRPPLKFVGFVPILLYLRNPRAGLVQGGSARAEPDALSRTSVVTVGHPSAIVALCRPVSANPRLTSAYLRLRPPASVSVGDRRSRPELNRPLVRLCPLA
ncbi:hypothetical protein BKA83DRAFT_4130679 [Pisolithus microcarpus]|nr:hypothetical protein BKA83DRAFT_4130679 [Pisolithus microcarpus]